MICQPYGDNTEWEIWLSNCWTYSISHIMCLELAPGYGERVDRGGWKLEMKIMITD